MFKYDVVIVGAGPSGAITAYWCAKYGLSTLVIEKCRLPRYKPCGGAVSSRAMKELDFKIDEVVKQTYYEGKIFRPKGDFLTLKSNTPLAVGVLRSEFDDLLIQKAKSQGAHIKEGIKVEKVTRDNAEVTISCEGGFKATADFIVAADGVNSIVAKQTGLRSRLPPNEVALACVFEKKLGKQAIADLGMDSLEFYMGLTPAGYGWIFPKGDYLSVGAGSLLNEIGQVKMMFPNFINKVNKIGNIKLQNPDWHLVPIGGKNRSISEGRTILVGDAAGFVDPLIGEGITYAILSGKNAAISIKTAIETREPEKASQIYKRNCKELLDDLSYAYFVATKIYYHTDLMMSPFLADKRLGEFLTDVIKGDKNYKTFILNSMKRLPISFLKMLLNR